MTQRNKNGWTLALLLVCSSGCATLFDSERELAWKEAPGKNHEQMYKDSVACKLQARLVRAGYVGEAAKDQAMWSTYQDCMLAEGHTLVEVSK